MSTPIAIVVGAREELGRATAVTLHGAGLTVVAVDRSETGLKQLPDEIRREVADATLDEPSLRHRQRLMSMVLHQFAAGLRTDEFQSRQSNPLA
jgi:NADP-dependent 3-hydroxy acid dehydrogenase YdfG